MELDAELHRLTARQHSLVAWDQARSIGFTERPCGIVCREEHSNG